MSELSEQASDGMADDLLGGAVLAEAVRREASGTLEFEEQEYSCSVELVFEQNGEHGRGEYYKLTAKAGVRGQYNVQRHSQRFNDRGKAEEAFEEQVEKWELQEEERELDDSEEDNISLLGHLREVVAGSRQSSTESGGEESDQ